MKISNPFKPKTVAADASLEVLQKAFKSGRTLEIKNGSFKETGSHLVEELKAKLGIGSARMNVVMREFRQSEALCAIEDKIASELDSPAVTSGKASISGKGIQQLKMTILENTAASRLPEKIQMEYLQPKLEKFLSQLKAPPENPKDMATALAKSVMKAVAQLQNDPGQLDSYKLGLPETLNLAFEGFNTLGSATATDPRLLKNLYTRQKVAADPALRLHSLTQGVHAEIKKASSQQSAMDTAFRGNSESMMAVYHSNQKEMLATGSTQRLMDALCPIDAGKPSRTEETLSDQFKKNLHNLVTDTARMKALVSTLPEDYCVSVAAGANLIDTHPDLSAEQKTAMKDAFYCNMLALRVINPNLMKQSVTASAAFQSIAKPNSPVFGDYARLMDTIAARGRSFDSHREHAAIQSAQTRLVAMTAEQRQDLVKWLPEEVCSEIAAVVGNLESTAASMNQDVSDEARTATYVNAVGDLLAGAGAFGSDPLEVEAARAAIASPDPDVSNAYAKLVEAVVARAVGEGGSSVQ